MSKSVHELRKEYHQMVSDCKLSKMEVWLVEEEISDILFKKGYDLINFVTAPCPNGYGHFNAIDCYTTVADKLVEEIRKHGYKVYPRKNPDKRSITWIIFPYDLIYTIRDCVEEFEEVK